MRLYDCTVRLNGSLLNCVRKSGVTAAEIVVLRHVHGQSENANDPITDITPSGHIDRSDREERARLMVRYRMGEVSGPVLIPQLLGVAGVPLPQALEGIEEPVAAPVEESPAEEPAPVRRRVGRPPKAAEEAATPAA
jgi:hypothetical protein